MREGVSRGAVREKRLALALTLQRFSKREKEISEGKETNVPQKGRRVYTNIVPHPLLDRAVQSAAAGEGISGKLNRLYALYQSSPNPGYTNILETLIHISGQDPTASDLLKDACTFVAMRTEIARQITSEEVDRLKRREWLLRVNTTPDAQAAALKRFDQTPNESIESLRQANEALTRVFSHRFVRRYGLVSAIAIERLSALTLSNVGPELWIRCDEQESPYPKPQKGTNTSAVDFLNQFKR